MTSYRIQSVERCFAVLNAIAELGGAARLATLQAATGLPLPTVHRFVSVLVGLGYVHRADNGVYLLGYALHRLSDPSAKYLLIRRLARHALRQLATRFDVTISLGFREGIQVVTFERISTETSIKIPVENSVRLDAHSTALGKAMLAFISDKIVTDLYAGFTLRSHTASTITSASMLRRRLVDIRNTLIARDEGETFDHIGCVATPILDREGRVLCAISASMPVWTLSSGQIAGLTTALKQAATEVREALYTCPALEAGQDLNPGDEDDE